MIVITRCGLPFRRWPRNRLGERRLEICSRLRALADGCGDLDHLYWAWVRIRTKAELPDVRIHDLRHSFASMGVAGGEGLVLIGKLLGHEHVVTTNRYAHLSDDPLQAAADRISERVAEALGIKPSH